MTDVPLEKLRFAGAPAAAAEPVAAGPAQGSGRDLWNRIRRDRRTVAAGIVVLIVIALAIIVPFLPTPGGAADVAYRYLPPKWPLLEHLGILNGTRDGVDAYAKAGVPDGVYHLFGTDELGRDMWQRVWDGTRVSLLIALIAFVIDIVVGMVYGLVSGYFGGGTDTVLQGIVEILSGIPQLVIVTLFVVAVGPGTGAIVFGLLLTNWLAMNRVSRSQALRQKAEEYVLASRTLGTKDRHIIVVQILPNIVGPVLTMSMFSIPAAIFTESYLSFVGMGVQPPQASLGSLVSTGYQAFLSYPYLVLAPVLVLAVLMVSFTIVADGLKEATDPRAVEGRA
ncbi:ABC transporter permease [Kineosporia sp. J2-2]|uniref:ABC transporter permease n=1 Tax=Kineosporia corallincola TaxID=2835133 RepID=A0ABS5TRV4_9ACTN|nr:ABC transporter permease [Kineosporia corallincola]MBT0773515.1 ABC transporter permease [Kineosporia corallincola]